MKFEGENKSQAGHASKIPAYLFDVAKSMVALVAISVLFCSCSHSQKPDNFILKDTTVAALHSQEVQLTLQIKEDSKNPILYYHRAKVYEAEGNILNALDDMRATLKIDSSETLYYLYIGNLYEKQPIAMKAITSYKRALDLEPKNKFAMLYLGRVYYLIKNEDQSFYYLNLAVGVDKYLSEAYYYRGMNFKEMKRNDNAILSFQAAVESNPKYFEACLELGLLNAMKKNPNALAYYDNALNIRPGNVKALYARGYYYQGIDSFRLAIRDYTQIIQEDAVNKNAHYNLGYNYYSLGQYQKALDHFKDAIRFDSAYSEAYSGAGLCYEELHNPVEAARYLKLSEKYPAEYADENSASEAEKPKKAAKSK